MGLANHQDFFWRASLNKLGHYLATEKAAIFNLAIKLAV